MAKPKLRKFAKNMSKIPRLKKMLAEYLTSNAVIRKEYDVHDMLLRGNRGFLACSEKELTNLFDTLYETLEKELQNAVRENEIKDYWHSRDIVKEKKEALEKAKHIYDEIFEQLFL